MSRPPGFAPGALPAQAPFVIGKANVFKRLKNAKCTSPSEPKRHQQPENHLPSGVAEGQELEATLNAK